MDRVLLVTGAAGFIGRHLVSDLRAGPTPVRAIDDLSCPVRVRPDDRVELMDVSRLTPGDLRHVDTIVHLAARKSVPASFADRNLMRTNIEVDRHLLELVVDQPVRRLILASSCEVYGEAPGELSEERPPDPRSPYAVGKVATELLARVYASLTPTEICCARLFNTFGPGEGIDAVVPRFVHDALNHGRLLIEGDGTQRRYFSYIDPVVTILRRLITAPAVPPVVNVAAGEERSVAEIAALVTQLIGPVALVHDRRRHNEIHGFLPDLTRLHGVVGPVAAVPFDEGVQACVAWERRAIDEGAAPEGSPTRLNMSRHGKAEQC